MSKLALFTHRKIRLRPDGRGGFTKTYRKVGELRGVVGLKTLTLRERSQRDPTPGRRTEKHISHVGYFRMNANLARGDQLESNTGTLFEVLSRRPRSDTSLRAEFELEEIQRASP